MENGSVDSENDRKKIMVYPNLVHGFPITHNFPPTVELHCTPAQGWIIIDYDLRQSSIFGLSYGMIYLINKIDEVGQAEGGNYELETIYIWECINIIEHPILYHRTLALYH
jgi:hypothetical protein